MSFRILKATALLVVLLTLLSSFSARASTTATLSDGEQLKLIGTGIYKELRNDIYVGTLYGPQSINDVSELDSDNVAKRMSLRFVSNYSNRKLARHWKERMAMNNPRSKWQPLTREIVAFSKLFKRSIAPGDEINIDHVPGVGTQIYLNGTLFKTFNKEGFQQVLLNVWLGNIPPTKAFKSSIRGENPALQTENINKYASISVTTGRFDSDLEPVEEIVVAEVKKEEKPAAKKKQTVAKVKPKPKPKKSPEKVASKKAEPKKTTPEIVETKPPVDPEPKIADKPADKPKEVVSKKEPKPIEEAEEPFFDADLIAGSYTRDLINSIRKYQEYPRKALAKQQEGDVTAKVIIGKEGNLISVELIERSKHRLLNKAVNKIIKKAAPFQPIPKELKLNEFQFEVPISFQL